MSSTTITPEVLWRLAEEAERRGVKIFHEPISHEHYALSGSDPTRLYRLTHWSCTCRAFMRWQRCGHWALFLAHLGWLPEVDPDPDPAPPAAGPVARQAAEQDHDPADVDDRITVPLPQATPIVAEEPPVEVQSAAVAPDLGVGSSVTPMTRQERAAALAETIDQALERLADQLASGHSAEYLATLAFYARFHTYSLGNVLLIKQQCPEASRVAGLRTWNQAGYRIKAGSRAIWIRCPVMKKEVDAVTGIEQEVVVGFRPGPVFDASQLANVDERPLPQLIKPLPDDVAGLYEALKQRIEGQGIAVDERLLPARIYGASQGGKILVRAGLDSRNRLLVLLHELCHELAHQGEGQQEKPVEQREFEAESGAAVVAHVLGLEHPTAADYLLSWQATPETLRASLTTVQGLTRKVLAIVQEPDEAHEAEAVA